MPHENFVNNIQNVKGDLQMIMNRKFRIALIAGVIAVFCVIHTCWFLSLPNYKNNKKRIALQVDTDFSYKSIYISEASFENDMTNLCRFTLKKPKQLKNFVPFSQLNKKKKDDIETFYNTDWGDQEDDDSFDSVNEELSSLRSSPKTRYIHHNISNDMSYELYIYNEEMNVGYHVVLIF
ncbi:hypothetical protein IV49_GL000574 [Kandleria vitulina DSM 20405]|uniref:Uncharacterized protein n=2 Tax=Kandleria vitulina TaxID=1630 RepID=A0A0R2HAE4_9FIRM|nr:hypothetical protein [Kandleria vitulina]KRN49873.1 hypothetical protein IV49_GL000574 [Kandleria vitulina DSM 20405]